MKQRLKICFVVGSFPTLIQTFILNQITGMIDLGHSVEIFAFYKPKNKKMHPDVEKYDLMSKVHYISEPKNKVKRIFRAIFPLIKNFHNAPLPILRTLNFFSLKRKGLSFKLILWIAPFPAKQFDIWHFCFGPIGVFGLQLKKIGILNGKFITSFHGFDISQPIMEHGKNYYNSLFKKGDIFLPVCDHFKDKLIDLGCDENKIITHRTGIDLNVFSFKKNIKRDTKTAKLITIGRFIEKKGIIYGIEAAAKVIRKLPYVEYKIIGEGYLEDELKDLIVKLNIEKNVTIHGFKTQPEIISLLHESDILIAPSITAQNEDLEGIPNVLKEAMAVGLPVISTRHAGIPELIQDGVTGFLVDEKDAEALADKILSLIENPEVYAEISINARKYIENNYDIAKLNRKLEEIYYRCLRL